MEFGISYIEKNIISLNWNLSINNNIMIVLCKNDYMRMVCYGDMPIEKTYFIKDREYDIFSFDGEFYKISSEYENLKIPKNEAKEYFFLRDEIINLLIN